MKQRQRPNIVSVHLSPEAKSNLDAVCEQRGMTIKSLLGRLIEWFVELDKTEQSIVLKQVEIDDVEGLAHLVLRRESSATNGSSDHKKPRRRRVAVD
jgi:hypothetical protein